jgi:cytoskeletal protein RodZ
MLKSFYLKALRVIVLTLLLVQMAVASALAQEISLPQEASPPSTETKNKQEETVPVRTDLTTDARKTANSSEKEPESVSSPQTSKTGRPVDPYSKYYEGIKKFNQEVYGKEG